jgi:hypothetical protein
MLDLLNLIQRTMPIKSKKPLQINYYMKIKQLIKQLQQFDPETMAVVAGYEGGYNEISNVGNIRLNLNVNKEWYYGKHKQDNNGECRAIHIG